MKVFGLIGYPLSHSFSENYFREKFQRENITGSVYKVFPLEKIEDFKELCKSNNLAGLNVTIPYKEKIISYLDELNDDAAKVGAVNTIKFSNGIKSGYNSDIFGFEESLRPLLKPHHSSALILGTGGASKAVAFVLNKLGIDFRYVSTSQKMESSISYQDLNASDIQQSTLIINTSPVGMYPNVDEAPALPYNSINESHLLYDLVYNPAETAFLKKGKEKGAQTKNGLEMLHLQAEKSWEIWNNHSFE